MLKPLHMNPALTAVPFTQTLILAVLLPLLTIVPAQRKKEMTNHSGIRPFTLKGEVEQRHNISTLNRVCQRGSMQGYESDQRKRTRYAVV